MIDDVQLEQAYQRAIAAARKASAFLEGPSTFGRLARLPAPIRESIIESFSTMDRARLCYHWPSWARPKQRPKNTKRLLKFMAGRAFGKNHAASNRVKERVYGGARALALIGPTLQDIERYMLGPSPAKSGLLDVFHPKHRPRYTPHKGLVHFHTGAIGYVVTAEKPEFRGANLDTVWCDELAQWRYLKTIWHNMEMATRMRCAIPLEIIVTTTPLPMRFLKELVADEDCTTILGSQRENAENLDPVYVRRMQKKYGGTRLGLQELEGEILTDNPDALFHASIIDATRVESPPSELRIVVAVDPAISTEPGNDETGIVVLGIDDDTGHMYVLADGSGKYSPEQWGKIVIAAYEQWSAVAVVCERNRGGDLVASNVRAAMERRRGAVAAKSIKVVDVHASRGKQIRAEPVSTLHEKGMIHFVGALPEVEKEITEWNPKLRGTSPNRLDAIVWGAYHLGKLDAEEPTDYRTGFSGLGEAVARRSATTAAGPARASASLVGLVGSMGRRFGPGGL